MLISGWIPILHASNAPQFTQSDEKKSFNLIQKKFKVNQSVKTRVLKIYQSQVILTYKSDLLSNDFEILSQYEDAAVNSIYRGVIIKVWNVDIGFCCFTTDILWTFYFNQIFF